MIDRLSIDGEELTKVTEVKKVIVSHFKQLYSKQASSTFEVTSIGLNKLNSAYCIFFEDLVTHQEIKEAMLSYDPSKAPGYNGFNLRCLRKVWPIIGEEFSDYIINFFNTGNFHSSLNTT